MCNDMELVCSRISNGNDLSQSIRTLARKQQNNIEKKCVSNL